MYYRSAFLSDNHSLDQEPVHIYFADFLLRHKEIVTKVLTLVVDEALRTSSTTKTQFVLQLFAEINLFFMLLKASTQLKKVDAFFILIIYHKLYIQ